MVFDTTTGIAADKIIDRELLEQFKMASGMTEEEKYVVKKMLEGIIVKHQVDKMMRPRIEKSWPERFREITDRLAKGVKDYSQNQIDNVIDEAVAAVRKKNMPILKAVIDTSVMVSVAFAKEGPAKKLRDMIADGAFVLVTSSEILKELYQVLHYPRIIKRFELRG